MLAKLTTALLLGAFACTAKPLPVPADTGTNDVFDPETDVDTDTDTDTDTDADTDADTDTDSGIDTAAGTDSGSVDTGPPEPLYTCGDEVVEEGEEYDPPPGPYTTIIVDDETCRWDFSGVRQLYCNGACSWSGVSGCDATEADIFCKLLTDNPESTATSWTDTLALDEPGFPCGVLGYGTFIDTDRGIDGPVFYQDTSISADHGPGSVIVDPVCTDPS